MLILPPSVSVWVAADPVDMRLGIDGLSSLVASRWKLDPYGGHLFLFFGRRKDRLKILTWNRGGFLLAYKRLEQGRFRIPKVSEGAATVRIDAVALAMLLDGIDLCTVRRPKVWTPPTVRAA